METVLNWSTDRVYRLNDLVDDAKFSYLWTDASNLNLNDTDIKVDPKLTLEMIESVKSYLQNEQTLFPLINNQTTEEINRICQIIREIEIKKRRKKATKTKATNLWKITRLVLIGSIEGPPVAEIFSFVGQGYNNL